MELHGKYTLFAEGARGSLTKRLIRQFNLATACDPQKFGIGIKELWQIDPEQAPAGPGPAHAGLAAGRQDRRRLVHVSLRGQSRRDRLRRPPELPEPLSLAVRRVPAVQAAPDDPRRTSKAASASPTAPARITEGGWQSIPKLAFPGGALIGCAAGFVNVPRIKGSHNAMKTGMLAAEAAFAAVAGGPRAATS